jgi:hypothetical protein
MLELQASGETADGQVPSPVLAESVQGNVGQDQDQLAQSVHP